MGTFLSICKDVARESGTVPTWASISTMQDQTGRIQRVGEWVNSAHNDIQRSQRDWLWLLGEFSGALTASTQTYTAASLLSAEDAARFSEWRMVDRDGIWAFSVYLTSAGQSTEQRIRYEPYQRFRQTYLFGSKATDTGMPQVVSVNPSQGLVFSPTPDAAYTVRGLFQKSPQTLSADADKPEMPAQFHDAIKFKALMHMAVFDEATDQSGSWEREYMRIKGELMDHQLPPFQMAGPLA